eukprot:15468773-Alexandrium_andersonii.AAC.1
MLREEPARLLSEAGAPTVAFLAADALPPLQPAFVGVGLLPCGPLGRPLRWLLPLGMAWLCGLFVLFVLLAGAVVLPSAHEHLSRKPWKAQPLPALEQKAGGASARREVADIQAFDQHYIMM